MGLFRCQNPDCSTDPAGRLIFDFEAAAPVCPKCRSGRAVVKLETVHLVVPAADGPIDSADEYKRPTKIRVACRPDSGQLPPRATAVAKVANCPACKATELYAATLADQEAPA